MARAISLYLDEDSSSDILYRALHSHCIEVQTTQGCGNKTFTDDQQMIWAVVNELTIYTYNASDFRAIHNKYISENQEHFGIITSNQSFSTEEILRAILKIMDVMSFDDIKNKNIKLGDYL